VIRSSLLLGLAAAAFVAGVGARALPPAEQVNDALIQSKKLPRTLGDFGFFRDPSARAPSESLIPYELNTPLYSDGADKLRFIYLPEGEVMNADGEGLLQFPVGTAIIKTFAFGEGDDQRYIETRVLLNRADGWLALPYRWNDEQTEAKLAVAGARIPITTPSGEEISYRIPNKNQCKTCHSKDGELIPIGPKARNLSRDWLENQTASGNIAVLPTIYDTLPHWDQRDEVAGQADGTEMLARAYLDVNCAHCHQPGGMASNSGLDLRWEQDDPHAVGIRKPPVAAGRGSGGHKVSIAPGNPDQSIMIYRMSSNDPGIAMPELGKSTIDEDGLAVIRDWVSGLETN